MAWRLPTDNSETVERPGHRARVTMNDAVLEAALHSLRLGLANAQSNRALVAVVMQVAQVQAECTIAKASLAAGDSYAKAAKRRERVMD